MPAPTEASAVKVPLAPSVDRTSSKPCSSVELSRQAIVRLPDASSVTVTPLGGSSSVRSEDFVGAPHPASKARTATTTEARLGRLMTFLGTVSRGPGSW